MTGHTPDETGPIDPEGHIPIDVNVVSGPIRHYGVEYIGYENSRQAIQCIICRKDWPCDWLERKHPGLREKVAAIAAREVS